MAPAVVPRRWAHVAFIFMNANGVINVLVYMSHKIRSAAQSGRGAADTMASFAVAYEASTEVYTWEEISPNTSLNNSLAGSRMAAHACNASDVVPSESREA